MTTTREEYEKEKAAAKLVSFYKTMSDFFAVYMELKMYYPPLADMVEKEFPFLRSMYEQAADDINYTADKADDKETFNDTHA